MQKLEERNTYTPTDIPHVSGNCDWILNRPETSVHAVSTHGATIRVCDVNWHNGLEETLSVSGLKTSSNNSDAALIAIEHAKQNMSVSAVYVLNMRGQPLMPTTPRKAKQLLKEDKVSTGKLILDVKIPKGFKPETFMSIVRWKLVNKLKAAGNIVNHTYGYITKFDRIALGLEKSHSTDAFVIAGGTMQERSSIRFIIKQVRKCNRKLFKGDRSHIKNTAARIIHGFQRFDKVLWNSIECFVFGRRKTGYFELRTLDGTKIHASAKAKDLKILESANTLLIAYMDGVCSSPSYKSGVSATPAPHGRL